jgi:hypothetical protein
LLLTDAAAAPVRPTLDVDAIIAVGSYAEFTELETRMHDLGFKHSLAEGAPICRWVSGDLILDLMPTRRVDSRLQQYLVCSRPRKCATNPDRRP